MKAEALGSSFSSQNSPWNLASDSVYWVMGIIILVTIILPTMTFILISTGTGWILYWFFYDFNPLSRFFLEYLRGIQREFFKTVGNIILMDSRDHPILVWTFWGTFVSPCIFYWAYSRYIIHGFEVSTFLIYHYIRLGPRYRFFAHHATLVHKEGHSNKMGLYRNIRNMKVRKPLPKFWRRCLTDHIVAGISGIFYGSIPNHYATAHNKIHHRWHNDTGDVHTNMDFDRSLFSSYILYLPRFVGYWIGVTPIMLFWKRKEYKLLRDLFNGMVYYYSVSAFVWYKTDSFFYWAYLLYPLLESASFLGIIAYLWHAFSEESDPSNQYVNSITILRGKDNIWNEDYHVVHHHEPLVHWTDAPRSFEEDIRNYVKSRATVFGDCEQGQLVYWMFGERWNDLTDHFIDLQYVFSNGELNSDCNNRLTVRQIREKEYIISKEGKSVVEKEQFVHNMVNHHEEVKGMLLRRLRYHYRGNRKEELGQFLLKMSKNIRDLCGSVSSEDVKKYAVKG